MNQKTRLKLVTFVLSMICAASGAVLCHYSAEGSLRHNERAVLVERTVRFDEAVDGRLLIDQWKRTKTAEEQRRLWGEWTQLKLGEESWWFSTMSEDTRPVFEILKLLKKPEELEKLKSEGWQTLDGEPLHLTPEQVWSFVHRRKIRKLKKLADSSRVRFWTASPVGTVFGFCSIWMVYAAANWIVWPGLKRIAPGFHKEKRKGKARDSGAIE